MMGKSHSLTLLTALLLVPVTVLTAAENAHTIKPDVQFIAAPLAPSATPPEGPSVLMGFSPFYGSAGGLRDVKVSYQPVREGGFRIQGSNRSFNRPIIQGQNRVWTGDVPVFRMDTYGDVPLWTTQPDSKPTALKKHSLGTLRLGVAGPDGKTIWLDSLSENTTATFLPGYTDYEVASPSGDWKASLRIAPTTDFHGLVCRIAFDRPMPLVAQYGDVFLAEEKPPVCDVVLDGAAARLVDPRLSNGMVLAGWDGEGVGAKSPDGNSAVFTARTPRRTYHVFAVWGVTRLDPAAVEKSRQYLFQTPFASEAPAEGEKLWQAWLDCYVHPALKPEENFRTLLAAPAAALAQTVDAWNRRREEFQIRTPDEHLDALMNWARAASDYHRQGPGLYLGTHAYCRYAHISCGWYGKIWGGDHWTMAGNLKLYAATQVEKYKKVPGVHHGAGEILTEDGGFIAYFMPNLQQWLKENNTPFWVEQVWHQYRWTGDKEFARLLWPVVRKAVAWELANHDPDGDGLFISFYPYWNGDSYACLEKALGPTSTGYAMLSAAAGLGEAIGQTQAAAHYRALAEKNRIAANRQLWNEEAGVMASLGSDGLRYAHPNNWELSQAVTSGLVDPARGRRAMHWLESRYGFEGVRPDVRLLMTSDLWPLRWSNHWVANGDTLLCALAAMKCGEVDLWWPYLQTAVHSSFRSEYPGINFVINNTGAGSGDREDVDSDDPHTHMAVRGLFGIEPAIDDGKLYICPAFPAAWTEASIQTPDVSYDYRREGDKVTFRIRTPRPLVKHVRARLTGPEVVTPPQTESVVTVATGPALPELPGPSHPPTVAVNRQPAPKPAPLSPTERERLVLVDLAAAYNITAEQLMTTPMLFDNHQTLMAVKDWWGNPSLTMPPTPRQTETQHGVRFLTAGRPEGVDVARAPKSLVALSSWRPYPWPAGVVIPIGRKCERLWLLLQNYVHPSKCYVSNGEVVLRYADGKQETTSLVPPHNLDCFYQHFSRDGVAVPFGKFDNWPPKNFSPTTQGYAGKLTVCHADALEITGDPARVLEAVELRATCSEGILGLAGLTLLTR